MADPTVGPVVTPLDIELAVRETLKRSIPFYLGEVDEQLELARGTTLKPRDYIARAENERYDEETPPVVIVACPGTVGEPVRHGDRGSYGAWWQVNIGVTVGGATEEGTRGLASRHLAALMLCIAGQPEMGGLAQDTRWMGGRPDLIGPQRTLMGCEAIAYVYVARVVDSRGVPRDIPVPYENDPAQVTPAPSRLRVRVNGNNT